MGVNNKDYLKWINKICSQCGKSFKTQWILQKYCSRECYKSANILFRKEWKQKHGSSRYGGSSTLYQRKYRKLVLEKLGNVCKKCGYSDVRALHIDHVNGDGKKERNMRKSLNRKIVLGLVDISRYQLLCANCNWIKKVENNE